MTKSTATFTPKQFRFCFDPPLAHSTLYKALKEGKIKHYRLGRQIRITDTPESFLEREAK
jgi:hypothetical protein